jgi:hypothetical protein
MCEKINLEASLNVWMKGPSQGSKRHQVKEIREKEVTCGIGNLETWWTWQSYILIRLSICDTTILLQKHSMAESASAFSMAESACRWWWSSGPSQKADRARPGILGLPNFHQPGPPCGVPGRVRHRRPTGPGPAPHGYDKARHRRVVCVWRGRAAVARAEVSWVSSVSCLLCSREQKLLGIGNGEQHGPLGRKRI